MYVYIYIYIYICMKAPSGMPVRGVPEQQASLILDQHRFAYDLLKTEHPLFFGEPAPGPFPSSPSLPARGLGRPAPPRGGPSPPRGGPGAGVVASDIIVHMYIYIYIYIYVCMSVRRVYRKILRAICSYLLFRCSWFGPRFPNRPPFFPRSCLHRGLCTLRPMGQSLHTEAANEQSKPIGHWKKNTSCISEMQCTLECTSAHLAASLHDALTLDA